MFFLFKHLFYSGIDKGNKKKSREASNKEYTYELVCLVLFHICTSRTVPTFNSCTKCVGKPGHSARPIATQFPGHECIDDLTIENNFFSQAS